jgi:hypothetical protein
VGIQDETSPDYSIGAFRAAASSRLTNAGIATISLLAGISKAEL